MTNSFFLEDKEMLNQGRKFPILKNQSTCLLNDSHIIIELNSESYFLTSKTFISFNNQAKIKLPSQENSISIIL